METKLEDICFILRRLDAKLTFVGNNQLEILTVVSDLSKKVQALGKACANGFYQTRDAAECLRSELSSCTGTLIEATNCDLGVGPNQRILRV